MDPTPLRRIRSVSFTLAAIFASAIACKGEGDAAQGSPSGEEGAAEQSAPAESPPAEGEQVGGSGDKAQGGDKEQAEDPRGGQVTITRAEASASVSAKGAKNMGFNLEKIWHLFALGATAKLPDWGAAGEGEAQLAHDDDLDSAWVCEHGQDKPCVLGLGLPEPAKVEAIRLYTGAGPRFRDYTGHPRVAKVRVHTDTGYVDVSLSDGANHSYVRFSEPVTTQSLAIEVLDVHAGKKDKLIHFAEVEVYGTEGVPRPPMALDPRMAWAGWETTVWGGPEGDHTIRQIFIYQGSAETLGEPESRKRIARATAVYGLAEDDYALFERLNGTDCDSAEGGYVLFDKRSRMY